MNNQMTLEMATLKTRLKATWMAGDYGHFAQYLEPGALEFLARFPIAPGTHVLDVACGAGQLAIPLARAGANVTGVDIAANSIAQAQARAEAEELTAQFDEGDAEDLPYDEASFDIVFSLIGAMFAPRPERVAAELTRVCRPGGRIIMGNWTPVGFTGHLFKAVSKYAPPSPLMAPPVLWGDEATVRERFSNGVSDLQLTRRLYPVKYPFSASEIVELLRLYYGPTVRAFEALDAAAQAALSRDLEALYSAHNQATDGTIFIEAEYLEVVAARG